MSDNDIEYDLLPENIGKAEITAYLDKAVDKLREMVRNRPQPPLTDNLTAGDVQKWLRVFMYKLGETHGKIAACADLGHITRDHAKQLDNGIKALINFHVGSVILGR